MKKILTLAIAVLISFFSARAQDDEKTLVINAGDVQHLVLGNNMKIVLLEQNRATEEVRFSKAVNNKLKVSLHDGTMFVSAQHKHDGADPIYIVVNELKSLTLGENTSIETEGVLSSAKLEVFVEVGARALLRTRGKVNANSLGDFDVSVEKNAAGIAKVF